MLAVAGGWLLFGAVFCGVGSWFFRAPADERISWADCFLGGAGRGDVPLCWRLI